MSTDRVVRVLPDVPAIDRTFDYVVPARLGATTPGTMVRVPLSGRSVTAWVLEDDVEPTPGRELREVQRVIGHGPAPDLIELCRWAAWRWAGRLATLLRLASPQRAVTSLAPVRVRRARQRAHAPPSIVADPAPVGTHVVEVSPVDDPLELAVELASRGQVIVVSPSVLGTERLARGLRSSGAAVAQWPGDWAGAAAGATVVGGRSAVFAPAPALSAIVVIDEHDERLQSESSPTWHAREVAVERARRAGVPCLLVSPCPSLEALVAASDRAIEELEELPQPTWKVARSVQRAGWSPVGVIDRRGEDVGRTGMYSSRVVEAVRDTARSGRRVVCVLNRTGRSRLVACRSCGTMAECELCGAALRLDDDRRLACTRCGTGRPGVCAACGSSALALLRIGVTRAREELEALAMEPVVALSGTERTEGDGQALGAGARVFVGTEAALHRVTDADLVVFLDLDQELLAPRYRAAEEALALLVRASRLLGGRRPGARLLLQTRLPDHEVVQAALAASSRPVSEAELARRRMLGFPPAATVAVLGGEAAPAYLEAFGEPAGVEVMHPDPDRWILRARDGALLLDHLAAVRRPGGRLKLQVDPARVR